MCVCVCGECVLERERENCWREDWEKGSRGWADPLLGKLGDIKSQDQEGLLSWATAEVHSRRVLSTLSERERERINWIKDASETGQGEKGEGQSQSAAC